MDFYWRYKTKVDYCETSFNWTNFNKIIIQIKQHFASCYFQRRKIEFDVHKMVKMKKAKERKGELFKYKKEEEVLFTEKNFVLMFWFWVTKKIKFDIWEINLKNR